MQALELRYAVSGADAYMYNNARNNCVLCLSLFMYVYMVTCLSNR